MAFFFLKWRMANALNVNEWIKQSAKHMNLNPLMIFPSLLGCAVFKLASGEIKVHPQPWNDWGNLNFLPTVPTNVCQTKSETSHNRAFA